MNDDVGIGNQCVDGDAVEDVALPILGFGPSMCDGSNGRRAIPMIRSISGRRSNASTAEIPISPVGPVMATVSAMREAFPAARRLKRQPLSARASLAAL